MKHIFDRFWQNVFLLWKLLTVFPIDLYEDTDKQKMASSISADRKRLLLQQLKQRNKHERYQFESLIEARKKSLFIFKELAML